MFKLFYKIIKNFTIFQIAYCQYFVIYIEIFTFKLTS